MKKVAVVVAMIGLMLGGISAHGQVGSETPHQEKQMDQSPDQRAEKRTQRMKETLSLTEDQTKKVGEINLKHEVEMESVRVKMRALKEEARVKREAYKKELDQVLTEEQRKLLEAKKAENKEKRAQHKPECTCKH